MTHNKRTLKNIPRKYLAIGLVSLGINALVFTTLIVGQVAEKTGMLDYAIVNTGIEHLCSDQFRATVEQDSKEQGESDNDRGVRLALIDYPCKKHGAADFYDRGFKLYTQALGLTQPDNEQ